MVIILGENLNKRSRFISVRWKLVSTYLLLVIITLGIINIFVSSTLLDTYIREKEIDILTKANIISKRMGYFFTIDPELKLDTILNNIVSSYSKEIDSRVLVVNKDGLVISDSNNSLNDQKLTHKEVKKALQGISNSNIYKFRYIGHVMYVAVPIVYEGDILGSVFISTSLNEIYEAVNKIEGNLRIISISSILLIAVISYIFANIFFKPIEKFTKVINKMAKGDLGCKVNLNTNDEFKQMANAFNIMSTKLNEVDMQRKNFVANVSHELRTPIASIKLLAESLLHQNEENVMIYREFLKDIDSEMDRLNNIINDLLVLVDLDKKKLNLNYTITYVNFLIEKIVSRLKPLADRKNIELTFEQKEKIQIKIDKDKIQQAIINIIDNAIKYTPEGGKVKVSLYSESKYVVIKIQDNGVGIPKESLPYIFDRFYRVDKARARRTGGTGLGLSIAHQIVSFHQGVIEVESEVNKGSAFYIKIPYDVNL